MSQSDDTQVRLAEPAPAAGPEQPPGAGGRRPRGLGPVGWLRWFWRTLTSMRTALILLFLFAIASVPGSLFPQRGVEPGDVAQYFADNPERARWLDRFWLFDVFQAPWFAAIYLLLFVSLVGCIIPRLSVYFRELRRRPPAAPRNLARLPHSAVYDAGDDATVETLAGRLRRRGFRVTTGPGWVAAEKGYLREAGNLLFHVSLVGMLLAVGLGSLYGYRGNVLLVEGNGFANTVAAYDRYMPGSQVPAESLAPFSLTLDDFRADYAFDGPSRGQVLGYSAKVTVTDRPGAAPRDYTVRVNHPLEVDGTQTYLIDHGYAPTFKVVDGNGDVAFDGATPCLAENIQTFASECTIKVPDARPDQLGIAVRFLPTTVQAADGSYGSAFPAALSPSAQITAFAGDLGLRSGIPQSVYLFDQDKLKQMKRLVMMSEPLAVGKSLELPGGHGTVTFTGVKEWAALQIAHDPGRFPALLAAAGAVLGIILSLLIRRRRVWVRVKRAEDDGSTVVEVGGLTRTEGGDAGFAEEFADIVTALRGGAGASREEQESKDVR